MINVKYQFKKDKLNKKNKNELILIELEGLKKDIENKKEDKKLNISLCIDVSGSMEGNLKQNLEYNFLLNNNLKEINFFKNKLEMVKDASCNAINIMKDGDIVSVVAFETNAQVIVNPTVLTKDNRNEIKDKIKKLIARGGTDINNGWLKSVELVAQNIDKEKINRVILLSDGQTINGEKNTDVIANNVRVLSSKSISTSTFGVGEDFNEDLLLKMSKNGNGNFYFIAEDNNFDQMFSEEFTGLSNIVATEIKLKLDLTNKVKLKEEFNELKKENDFYLIQDLTSKSNLSILFDLNTELLPKTNNVNLGKIIIEYKNEKGEKEVIEKELLVEQVSEKDWEKLNENKEVKIQEILLIVAKNKIKASIEVGRGNRDVASNILRASASILNDNNINDQRLGNERSTLETTITGFANLEANSNEGLKKSLMYQSYKTTSGKL